MIHLITIILMFLMTQMTQNISTKRYNGFNTSCLKNYDSQTQFNTNGKSEQKMISFPLRIFQVGKLYVDLRHIYHEKAFDNITLILEINNTDTNTSYKEYLPLAISIQVFQIQASNNLIISSHYNITGQTQDQLQGKQSIFRQTLNIDIISPSLLQERKSFLFVITNQDVQLVVILQLVGLPYNIIDDKIVDNFPGYFFTPIQEKSSLSSRLNSTQAYSDYWNGRSSIVLPYIPYLSNCIDSGNYLNFAQIISNESECNLYGQSSIPIEQFKFGSYATADKCKIIRSCIYDEIPQNNLEYPFWHTLDTKDLNLFSITSKQYDSLSLQQEFDEIDLVSCKISSTSGTNSSNLYPLKVTINFGYYQVTNTQKRMMKCQINYSLYVQSKSNFVYNLQINFYPLNHTTVLLNFGFQWYIYIIVFVIIGLISNLQFLIFWIYHLIVTIKPKIHLSFMLFLRLCKEIFKGFLPASLIIILLTFIVEIVMQGTIFGDRISQNYASFWDYMINDNIGFTADKELEKIRSSRMGFSYIIISTYIMIELSNLLIGHERSKQEYEEYEVMGRKFKPKEWNRGKLLFGTFIYIISCITFIYYTQTKLFNNYIWYMIGMMQIMQMIIQKIVFTIYEDHLPALPFKITLGALTYLSTMGAIDLYYFILGYLVDVGIATIQLIYLSGLQEKISNFIIQKSEQINRFYINLLHDEQEQNDKKSDKNDQINNNLQILLNNEVDQVQILEEYMQEEYYTTLWEDYYEYEGEKHLKVAYLIYLNENNKKHQNIQKLEFNRSQLQAQEQEAKELQNNKFQLLIDGTIGMLQYMMQPLIVLILWVTFDTSNILKSYGISKVNCILYFLSSVILAIFFQLNIIIILHVVELYFNFDYKNLVNQLLETFQNKKNFWIVDSTAREQKDEKYSFELRAISKYSMSSQMYFIISLYICCMYFFIIGFNTIITAKNNVIEDYYMILITFFWVGIMFACKWFMKKILYILNIWGYKSLQKDNKNNDQTNLQINSSELEQETNIYLRKQEWIKTTVRFTFQHLTKQFYPQEQQSQKQKKVILSSKLTTICKKLQPQFNKQDFKLQYAQKHKQFIKDNIQKILPLITQFADYDIQWFNRNNQDQQRIKNKENKNSDPLIIQFMANWVKRVELNRAKRQENGAERQKKLKKCHFCYNTWGLYYGYDGMCFQCTKKLIDSNKMKAD